MRPCSLRGAIPSQQGDQNNQSMESLLANEELNVDMPQAGEIRTGIIASIGPSQILVSIGAKSEGVISGRELEQLSARGARGPAGWRGDPGLRAESGGRERQRGSLPAARPGADLLGERRENAGGRPRLREQDRGLQQGRTDRHGRGPARVSCRRRRSAAARRAQATGDTPEQRWQKMVGQPITVRIIEVDRERRRLILSERAASSRSPGSRSRNA